MEVYNTPVMVQDLNDLNDKVVFWGEHNLTDGSLDDEGYYFVRYNWDGNPTALPTCEVRTEEDFGPLPSPTDVPPSPAVAERDGAVSTPTFLGGVGNRTMLFPTLMGWVNSYEIGSDGWPSATAGAAHHSEEVTDPAADAGTDTSGFVDPVRQVMVFGTKCPGRGSNDCKVDPGASPPVEWGRIFLTDISGAPVEMDHVDIEAWTFGAPVGLSSSAGDNGDELVIALGTYESVDAVTGFECNHLFDCSIITLLVSGSGGAWSLGLGDIYPYPNTLAPPDPDPLSCVPPDDGDGGYYHGAVDGFGGEPVPYNFTHLLASRYYGKIYSLNYSISSGALAKDWAVVLENQSGHEFRQPAEHSPVIGWYPDPEPSDPAASVFWGANQYQLQEDAGGIITGAEFWQSVVLEVDIEEAAAEVAAGAAGACDPVTLDCPFDIDNPPRWATVLGTIPRAGAKSGPLLWGPGATGIMVDKEDPTDKYLAYVIATAANTVDTVGDDIYCDAGEDPAQLHFFYKKQGAATWSHDTVDLSDDPGGSVCYEEIDNDAFGTDTAEPEHLYPRIDVPGGVSIQGGSVYVATSDGLFWMYGTRQGTATNGYHLISAAPGWPQFRKGIYGTARTY